ncbi:hypothetical protein ACIBBD_27560 [Streptomyces sp. NPDC051315]|uniref:hypothetical protein n=1 Tax=Streptomyces sp. NPDC051315 TaxID=3365650 RepID=UPI0037A79E32
MITVVGDSGQAERVAVAGTFSRAAFRGLSPPLTAAARSQQRFFRCRAQMCPHADRSGVVRVAWVPVSGGTVSAVRPHGTRGVVRHGADEARQAGGGDQTAESLMFGIGPLHAGRDLDGVKRTDATF